MGSSLEVLHNLKVCLDKHRCVLCLACQTTPLSHYNDLETSIQESYYVATFPLSAAKMNHFLKSRQRDLQLRIL